MLSIAVHHEEGGLGLAVLGDDPPDKYLSVPDCEEEVVDREGLRLGHPDL